MKPVTVLSPVEAIERIERLDLAGLQALHAATAGTRTNEEYLVAASEFFARPAAAPAARARKAARA